MLVFSNRHFSPCSVAVIMTTALLVMSGCSSSSDDGSTVVRLTTVAVDTDNDGMADNIVNWVYDAEGRATAEEFDQGADGNVDSRFARVPDGASLRIERDAGADGTVEGVLVQTFDANGVLVSETRAASDDGVGAENITYLTENNQIVQANIDQGSDGSVDVTARFLYDADGRLSGADFDTDGDEVTDNTLRVVREETGTVVRLEEDFGNDGGIDFVRTLTYEPGLCDVNDIANRAPPSFDICLAE